jgi:hypothetical protein
MSIRVAGSFFTRFQLLLPDSAGVRDVIRFGSFKQSDLLYAGKLSETKTR